MSKTPDIEKQMYGMIEFLTKEDLVDLVRDALVMKTDTIENAIKSHPLTQTQTENKNMILIPIALIILLGVLVFFVDWFPENEETEDERICAHTGEW